MANNGGLSVATHFGRQIRKARTAKGWTLRELSRRSEVDAGTISRIENGTRAPTLAVALAMDRVFPERTGWFADWVRESSEWSEVPAGFRSWSDYEEVARTLRVWMPSIIDGLLQTPDYAAALVTLFPGVSAAQARERATGRIDRQRRVLARTPAPDAVFLIDELALDRMVGGPAIMAAQLGHILDMASRPNVTIQVAPAIALPTHFEIILADGSGYCEHGVGGYVYTEPAVFGSLSARFEALRAECYRASESRDIIRQRRERYEQRLAEKHLQRHQRRRLRRSLGRRDRARAGHPQPGRHHAQRHCGRLGDVPYHPSLTAPQIQAQETESTMSSAWRKSTYSDTNGGNCVEVSADEIVLVRDTTNRGGIRLNVTASAWGTFLTTLR
jgi:transcriptional regulator with XRE-family HTH domain